MLRGRDQHQHLVCLVVNPTLLREAHIRHLAIALGPLATPRCAVLQHGDVKLVPEVPQVMQGTWVVLRCHVQKDWFPGSAEIQVIILHGFHLVLKITGFFITGNLRDGAKTHSEMAMAETGSPGDAALNADSRECITADTASMH